MDIGFSEQIKQKIIDTKKSIEDLGGMLDGMSERTYRGFLEGYLLALKHSLSIMESEGDSYLFLKKLINLYAEGYDSDSFFWNKIEGQNKLFVNCNDLFFWACGDAEEVTKENIDFLEECLKITQDWGTDLFCCKSRRMRPQGCIYSIIPEELHHYFDACGLERIPDMNNPVDQRDWKNYRDGKPLEYPLIIEIRGMK